MAGGKEIRTKIKSIQNTQKITKAMEMVAASKMRRAQERMHQARPYAQKMRNVIAHVSQANLEYKHSFTLERPVKRVGFIIVSSDRGLCGGLNINLFRDVVNALTEWQSQSAEIDLTAIGSKGFQFFNRVGANIVSEATRLGDTPHLDDLIGPVKVMLDAYTDSRIDRLYLVHNRFQSTMSQTPQLEQLVPIHAEQPDATLSHLYEPDAKDVVDALMTRYIESLVYQGVVENIACEMAARMVAMKSASDNAGDLIDELQLAYNKARQASITQEISEIVGGAAAV